MIAVINALVIEKSRILLVRKNNSWIFPGGKKEDGESELECVAREFSEELSGAKISCSDLYTETEGTSPNSNQQIKVKAYFAERQEKAPPIPSREIEKTSFFSYAETVKMPLSGPTRRIVEMLKANFYI